MITNISKETLNTSIITDLYRIRWQIELLFKVLKSTLSLDKMQVGKTKYVEAILYGKLLGALLTMPLYDSVDQNMLKNQGRGVSIQRFYYSTVCRFISVLYAKKNYDAYLRRVF